MKTGTKSLLFGVHQFAWHPFTVVLAWKALYGAWPCWKALVCIIVHDWGYWGKPNMDGNEGGKHPELGAKIVHALFDNPISGPAYKELVLYHSRHYACKRGRYPSLLCWADKYSIQYEPWWLYIPRAWLSGELDEYRKLCADAGYIPATSSHRRWFMWIKDRLVQQSLKREPAVLCNPVRQTCDHNG